MRWDEAIGGYINYESRRPLQFIIYNMPTQMPHLLRRNGWIESLSLFTRILTRYFYIDLSKTTENILSR
jgi:hypothetical protein